MPLSRRIIFFSVVFGILILFQYLCYSTFKNYLKRKNLYNNKIWKFLTIFPFVYFNLPFLYLIIVRKNFTTLPDIVFDLFIVPFYIFQGAIVFIGLFLLIGKLIKLPVSLPVFVLSKFSYFKDKIEKLKSKKEVKQIDNSRRKFVTGLTMAVSGYAFLGAGYGVLKKNDYKITNFDLPIKNLPDEFKGKTIALITDIHSGPYMSKELMSEYVDVLNSLKTDYIVIAGDITNTDRNEIIPFADSFKNLKANKGIYATLGNHDYFSDPEYIADYIKGDTPVTLLRNESVLLTENGKSILLSGMEDVRDSNVQFTPKLQENYLTTKNSENELLIKNNLSVESTPKILIYHKPYFIDLMSKDNYDLVLTGHTHGGQVVLLNFGGVNLSLAATVSPYISGLYTVNNSKMYVSRGLGSVALPLRLNCPPDIAVFKLT
ncbi:MAG TPA: metallophosphoesterase [Ignavibacteria bacterium]|nr:metallophosphoesterase [Ignavibacteria bacterium]